MGVLLQRVLYEDERGRIRNGDDGSRGALVGLDSGMGLLFDLSAAVVGMLKMAPNFVLARLSPSTYLPVTPRRPNSLRPRWMAILSIPWERSQSAFNLQHGTLSYFADR